MINRSAVVTIRGRRYLVGTDGLVDRMDDPHPDDGKNAQAALDAAPAVVRDAESKAKGALELLYRAETSHPAPDGRRLLRQERQKLQTAIGQMGPDRANTAELLDQASRALDALDLWRDTGRATHPEQTPDA